MSSQSLSLLSSSSRDIPYSEWVRRSCTLYLGGFLWNRQAQEHGNKLAYLIHHHRMAGTLELIGTHCTRFSLSPAQVVDLTANHR
jgi:hypothetical protein